jgi:hypothetical protein
MKGAAHTEDKGSVPGPTLRKVSEKVASTDSRLSYAPHPNATPEGEVAALAAVYRFLVDIASRRVKAAENTNSDDGREEPR